MSGPSTNSVETLRRRALARPARTSALIVFVIGFAPLALGEGAGGPSR